MMTNHLKVARAQNDLTQEQLAERVGVSRQSINSIEKSRYVPSTVLALKIARALNTDVHALFALEESD
ncbi:MAG: helix-turn-helix transcriptional regulator [Tunicatimonas sp.]